LGGHVRIGDHVVSGGQGAIAPFVRIGARAFPAGGALVERDGPPLVIAAGAPARGRGPDKVGPAPTRVPPPSVAALERAFAAIFRAGTPRAIAAAKLRDDPDPFVRALALALAPL